MLSTNQGNRMATVICCPTEAPTRTAREGAHSKDRMNAIEIDYHLVIDPVSTPNRRCAHGDTVLLPSDVEFRRLRPALGTFVAISGRAADEAIVQRAIAAAFGAFALVNDRMHPTHVRSDLTSIRESRVGCAVAVHLWTWEVLNWSQRLNAMSSGRFDPCVPESRGRIFDIDLPAPGTLVCKVPVVIDLGGVAKGFAVDRAIDALMAAECSEGQINAGGDVRCFGPAASTIWLRVAGCARPISLRNSACAVSDPARISAPSEHRGYYGPPGTAAAPVGGRAAIVVAPTAMVADSLTKCVVLAGNASDRGDLETLLHRLGATSLEIT